MPAASNAHALVPLDAVAARNAGKFGPGTVLTTCQDAATKAGGPEATAGVAAVTTPPAAKADARAIAATFAVDPIRRMLPPAFQATGDA